jgi:predicted nucleic acid-binding protein
MTVLVDSNILLRLAQVTHPMHPTARAAVSSLQQGGETLHTVPQNAYEFWVVATRPVAANGLGLSPAQADAELTRVLALFPLLPDTPAIFPEWRRLVLAHQVTGKNAHDVRLVAAMAVHGVTHLLTFNTADFARYPGITAVDPAAFAAAPPPPPPP